MKLRVLFVTALVLLLASLAAVNAQEVDPCFGLATEDCNAINEAYANLAPINSFSMEYSIDFSVSGIPESAGLGSSEITFRNSGSGALAVDLAALETAGATDIPVDMDLTMTSSWTGFGPDFPDASDVPSEFRVVDGLIYLGDGTGEWLVIDPAASADMGADALGFDPAALAQDPETIDQAFGMAAGFLPLLNVPGFLVYERNGDVFNFTADLTALLQSGEFNEAIAGLGESEDPNMQQAGMIVGILPLVFEDATVNVTQNLNPDLGIVDSVGFTVDATVNGALLDPEITEPIVITLAFNVTIADPNGEFDFVAPENATPIEELDGGM